MEIGLNDKDSRVCPLVYLLILERERDVVVKKELKYAEEFPE